MGGGAFASGKAHDQFVLEYDARDASEQWARFLRRCEIQPAIDPKSCDRLSC